MIRSRPSPIAFVVLLTSCWNLHAGVDDLPEPPPPADFTLVKWEQVVDYFRTADRASGRVALREIGDTTEGRPYVVAVISSEETIANLDSYREAQAKLIDPEILDDEAKTEGAIAASKPVVIITCSIHSSETASTFMALRLLHDLVKNDDAETREILDNVILLLVPSANPDGVDIVADWYARTIGKPWEGSGLPTLYHKYAGHDTNRDWFMLNLKETQLLTRLLYREWFPTITYDVHQMGPRGPRLFVPPFHDPINPNLHPRIHQGIAMLGAHMAFDLAAAGKRGVATRVMYDNWWNGGNRTTPQRHNMVGLLTEAASVKLASPIFVEKEELRGGGRGFPNHDPSVDFVDPWPGGWWRLSDIVDYELICARSVLTLAARYRENFQRNYVAMNRDALERGRSEPPFAWIVPADQRDPGTAAELVRILRDTGIVVQRASEPFEAMGQSFPAGSWILPAAQPYRPHLKDMMERQVYPERLDASGAPERPYDVAGWTLPLQMGVEVVEAVDPFEADSEAVDQVTIPRLRVDQVEEGETGYYVIEERSNADFRLVNALVTAGESVEVYAGDVFPPDDDSLRHRGGSLIVRATEGVRALIDARADIPARLTAHQGEPDESVRELLEPLKSFRIGVYQPWIPSMDEGWTRLVLEKFEFAYETIHNADVRAGSLAERFDVILIPSIGAGTLRRGYAPEATEPAYVGGLGAEGARALREFVEAGGTLVCLEDSCAYAIAELDLPVNEITRGLKTSEFYGPGSIVRLRYEKDSPLTFGMPTEGSAYFDRSLAFEPAEGERGATVHVAARYVSTDLLESGWLLGADKIGGKAALLTVPVGNGQVVLFGFPPQNRGQTHGTFRLLFNALVRPSY